MEYINPKIAYLSHDGYPHMTEQGAINANVRLRLAETIAPEFDAAHMEAIVSGIIANRSVVMNLLKKYGDDCAEGEH